MYIVMHLENLGYINNLIFKYIMIGFKVKMYVHFRSFDFELLFKSVYMHFVGFF